MSSSTSNNTDTTNLNVLPVDLQHIAQAANSMDSTILITGPTGSGKSHLAKQLHQESPKRRLHKFHSINLATLSENLLESELFGYERGAFTGADHRKLGRLEVCQGGTVFLDEIGELAPRLQAKLLDFIQYKKFTPIGSHREIEVDVRIIAATNKNLENCVAQGQFREDLYHRLKVFHLELDALQKNKNLIMELANFHLQRLNHQFQRKLTFSKDVLNIFYQYDWPGNMRELSNTIEYCFGLELGQTINKSSLPRHLKVIQVLENSMSSENKSLKKDSVGPSIEIPLSLNFHQMKEDFEQKFLKEALRLCRGQINLTSEKTGLNKVSLSEKIKKYSIDWKSFRENENHSWT